MRKYWRYRRNYLILTVITVIFLLSCLMFLFIDRGLKPAVIAMSEAQVRYITVKAMNNAVKKFLNSNIKYTDLINIMTDRNGKISLIQANTIKMNALGSETSSIASRMRFCTMGQEGIHIPLGAVFNSKILAGLGAKNKGNYYSLLDR